MDLEVVSVRTRLVLPPVPAAYSSRLPDPTCETDCESEPGAAHQLRRVEPESRSRRGAHACRAACPLFGIVALALAAISLLERWRGARVEAARSSRLFVHPARSLGGGGLDESLARKPRARVPTGPAKDPALGTKSATISRAQETAEAPTTTSAVVCSEVGENCTQSGCCADAGHRCFTRSDDWAGCMKSCSPGMILTEDWLLGPRTPWSCLLVAKTRDAAFTRPTAMLVQPASVPAHASRHSSAAGGEPRAGGEAGRNESRAESGRDHHRGKHKTRVGEEADANGTRAENPTEQERKERGQHETRVREEADLNGTRAENLTEQERKEREELERLHALVKLGPHGETEPTQEEDWVICTNRGENCLKSTCCAAMDDECYHRDAKHAECRMGCDPERGDTKGWSCKRRGSSLDFRGRLLKK